jgi:hypothetical protein
MQLMSYVVFSPYKGGFSREYQSVLEVLFSQLDTDQLRAVRGAIDKSRMEIQ